MVKLSGSLLFVIFRSCPFLSLDTDCPLISILKLSPSGARSAQSNAFPFSPVALTSTVIGMSIDGPAPTAGDIISSPKLSPSAIVLYDLVFLTFEKLWMSFSLASSTRSVMSNLTSLWLVDSGTISFSVSTLLAFLLLSSLVAAIAGTGKMICNIITKLSNIEIIRFLVSINSPFS